MINQEKFNKTTEEILLDLIYQSNQYRVPLSKIKFGMPEALDAVPGVLTDENTFIPADVDEAWDARLHSTKNNVKGFMYRREQILAQNLVG